MLREGFFCVLSVTSPKYLAVATVMGRRGISLGLTLYCLLCSYGLIPRSFSLLEGHLLIFFKVYFALKEQFYLCVLHVPAHFMCLWLKFFLPVYQTAVSRTVHLDIFLNYRLINFHSLVLVFFFLFFHFVWIKIFWIFIWPLVVTVSHPHSSM